MTRINVGVKPAELSREHLLAEHREIKRIPNCVRKGRYSMKGQPDQFKLGDGHVKFFYDKLGYLKRRYEALYAMCIERKYDVQYYGDAWNGIDENLMGDYEETQRDREIILERINERLNGIKDS
jgi:hypothetical protein